MLRWQSLFTRGRNETATVRTGARFRSSLREGVKATAQVLGITPDAYGIAHVRFTVRVQAGSSDCFGDQRTLTLASFLEHYPEPL